MVAKPKHWRPIAVVVAVLVLLVTYAAYGKQVSGALNAVKDWIESTGPWAPVVFVVVYVVGTVACFPGTILTVGAGAMFGPIWGLALVSVASTTGATCSFLIARYFARGAIARWLEGKDQSQRLDRMTRDHGGVVVAITRLIPLFPFTLLNYGFGLTGVRLLTYVVCSWIFMLPGTAAYVLVGAGAAEAAETRSFPAGIVSALLAVMVLLFFVGKWGRSYLKSKMGVGDEEKPESAGTPT